MIIDAHMHIFPRFGTTAESPAIPTHPMFEQNKVRRFWGRMKTSTFDEAFIPEPGEDVNFRFGKYGRWLWTKHGEACWLQRFPTIMHEMEWTPEQTITFMDEVGVEKGVLQAGYMETAYCRDYFAASMKQYPGRFIGTITMDYDIEKSAEHRAGELDILKNAVNELGMRGVFQAYPKEKPADHNKLEPLWEEISKLKVPHIFLVGFQPKADYLDSLERIERVLKNFPGLNAVIGHLGGNIRSPEDPNFTDTPKELMNILKLPNAYFEVGYVLAYENRNIWKRDYEYPYPLHTRLIRKIYDEVGADRLLWGSDMPNIYRTCTYRQCMDLVRLHFDFLTQAEKDLVLGGNAGRIFNVDKETG
jgi:predicted TIM-barrel fold metal-dependent hydrolase